MITQQLEFRKVYIHFKICTRRDSPPGFLSGTLDKRGHSTVEGKALDPKGLLGGFKGVTEHPLTQRKDRVAE